MPKPMESAEKLTDSFGRHVNYLRLSVTDRCDFRCTYCMNEKMQFMPRNDLLSLEELARLGKAFVDLGVTRLRITGGEPLVRKNVLWLFEQLGQLETLHDLTLTTNGSQLEKYADALFKSGVKRINISLDSLQAERFNRITRRGEIGQVLHGIEAAQRAGFKRIKLNTVIMKGRNHDEILDLVDFAISQGLDISFIEEMPLGAINDHGRAEMYYSSDEVRRDIEQRHVLISSTESTAGPSRYFRIANSQTHVGFISPHSHNFCDSCNRVRTTAEGRLLLCLGQEHSADLRQVMREHPHDEALLKQTIINAMRLKPKGHDFSLQEQPVILRHMNATGG